MKLFGLILLLVSKNEIAATGVGAKFLRNAETGQKIALIGDLHFAIPQSLVIERYLYNKIESLTDNHDIKVYFEGTKIFGDGIQDFKRTISGINYSAFNRLNFMSKEKENVYIDIENREFMLPILNIEVLITAGLFDLTPIEMNIFKAFCASEGCIKYANGPLRHLINLLETSVNNIIKETKENFPENDFINKYLDELKDMQSFISMSISLKLAKYLDTECWNLIENEFQSLYFNYYNCLSLSDLLTNTTSSILDFNCVNRIFKDKKDCIVVVGHGHIASISLLLKELGFEPELQYDLTSVDGKQYSSIIDYCNNEINNEPEEVPVSFTDVLRNTRIHDIAKNICPLSKEAIDEIFKQYE